MVVFVVVIVSISMVKIWFIRLLMKDEKVIKLIFIDSRINLIDIKMIIMFFLFRKILKILIINRIVVIDR